MFTSFTFLKNSNELKLTYFQSKSTLAESSSGRLAFLATDSDDSDQPATDARESRSRRSTRRRSSASRNGIASTPAAAAAADDDEPLQLESVVPNAEQPGAAEESVASRVRRRRSGREARIAGRRSSGQGDAGTDDAPAADGDVRVRRLYSGRRMLLTDSSSSSSSSSSTSPSNSDSQELGDGDSRQSRHRRWHPVPDQVKAEIMAEVKAIKEKPLPKHNFHLTKELINRQYCGGVSGTRLRDGCCARFGLNFSQRFYSSLHTVQRLELMSKLDYHQGCVNAVGFSNSGSILVSGSDDLQLALWEWNREKLLLAFPSGHRNNVFQVVLSAGEDGEVKEADLRQERPNTIAITTDSQGSRVALHSIHNHPINDNQFCVAGRDEYVCVYDRRITTTTAPPVLKYCPDNLLSSRPRANVTCAVYSNNGDAIVASYSDDDIYLFDTSIPCHSPPTHRYTGHRNSATVKGVNMFGPQSKFVISGSDCGNVFIWSRETEAIVRCFRADESGVVNVLEWHPHMPLLATSGLDNDVKVWIPSNENAPGEDEEFRITQTVENNLRERRRSSSDVVDLSDSRMIMMIWHHMRRMQGAR
ncbi:WD40 repeat, partial [Trinorchestia longiramus]